MLIVFVSLLFTCCLIPNARSSSPHPPDQLTQSGGHALNALSRLLTFFESNADNLNLDGLYGLRIAEGQLHALEQGLTSSDDKHVRVTDRSHFVPSLLQQIGRIANASLAVIAREQAPYLHRFSLVASQPFVVPYQARKVRRDLIEHSERNSHFDEEESDQCFAELLGEFRQCSSIRNSSFSFDRLERSSECGQVSHQSIMLADDDVARRQGLPRDAPVALVLNRQEHRLHRA